MGHLKPPPLCCTDVKLNRDGNEKQENNKDKKSYYESYCSDVWNIKRITNIPCHIILLWKGQ